MKSRKQKQPKRRLGKRRNVKARPSVSAPANQRTKTKRRRLPADPNDPREKALELMKLGVSETEAAQTYRIGRKRLARYRTQNTSSNWKGRKWRIVDRRPVNMLIASRGKITVITVPFRSKGKVGRYWNAVNQFLEDNDPSHLKPFTNSGIRDTSHKLHPWEADPNTLRKLDSIGELKFVDIYSNVAQ